MKASEAKHRLEALVVERADARDCGLLDDPAYGADLEEEIRVTRAAFVGAGVTEIATLRGQLSGRLLG